MTATSAPISATPDQAGPYLTPIRLSAYTRVSDEFNTVQKPRPVQVLSLVQLLTLLDTPRPATPGQRLIVCSKQSKRVVKGQRSHEYKTTVYCELTRQFYRASHATGARSLLKSIALKNPWVHLLRAGERYEYVPPYRAPKAH